MLAQGHGARAPGHPIAVQPQARHVPADFQQEGGGGVAPLVQNPLAGGVRRVIQPDVAALPRQAEGIPGGFDPRQGEAVAVIEAAPPGGQGQGDGALALGPGGVAGIAGGEVEPAQHHREGQHQRPIQGRDAAWGHGGHSFRFSVPGEYGQVGGALYRVPPAGAVGIFHILSNPACRPQAVPLPPAAAPHTGALGHKLFLLVLRRAISEWYGKANEEGAIFGLEPRQGRGRRPGGSTKRAGGRVKILPPKRAAKLMAPHPPCGVAVREKLPAGCWARQTQPHPPPEQNKKSPLPKSGAGT